jgi:predicted DCC family thiol-disulfide oxidoreductase YuxK
MMSEAAQLEVYTDGQCPLCLWMREQVERRDRFHRVRWLDYRDPEIQARTPYSFEELNAEMHTRRLPGGDWSAGYLAWLEVMRVLPHWRSLAPLLSVWPFTALGRVLYRMVATRRYKLFGAPPPCDANGVCSLHKGSSQ